MKINTQIQIDAKPQNIWAILMDFENYPQWNPFIRSVSGQAKKGSILKVDLNGMIFHPRVISLEKDKNFKWLGHLWIKGLFDGEHCFELIENQNGSTTLIHSENFKGILVPLLKKKLLRETKPGFETMNLSLKNRVEAIEIG